MRTIRGVKYEIIKESDVSEQLIYAFSNGKDISFLCRKNDKFFWKCLSSVHIVWYDMYTTIEKAIDGVIEKQGFKESYYGPIQEFESLKEFLTWANKQIK